MCLLVSVWNTIEYIKVLLDQTLCMIASSFAFPRLPQPRDPLDGCGDAKEKEEALILAGRFIWSKRHARGQDRNENCRRCEIYRGENYVSHDEVSD